MRFENQTAKEAYLDEQFLKFGDQFFPTLQHMRHLEEITDSLPVGQYSKIESRILTLGNHIRFLVAEANKSPQ